MATDLPTNYPKVLTNAAWQKAKGTLAKIATGSDGSGIGKRLDQLQAAHAKIDWSKFNFDVVIKVSSAKLEAAHVKQYLEIANAELKNALPARKLAAEVETEAKKVAGEWAKNKLIPGSSAKAAQAVSDAAKQLAYDMAPSYVGNKMKEEVAAAQAKIEKVAKFKQEAVDKVKRLTEDLISGAAKLKKPEEWNKFWMQTVRAVGTNIPMAATEIPKLKALAPKVKTWSSDQSNPKDAKELAEKVKQCDTMGKAIKAALA